VTLRADLCTLLQLDPERATPDDVLALVGGLIDAAGRLDRLRAALAGVVDASPGTLSQTAAAMRALREYGERAAPPSPLRPVIAEPEDWSECALHSTTAPSIARRALASDDAAPVPTVAVRTSLTTPPALRHRLDEVAAASAKPDLPLAEGSEWCSDGAIVEADGTRVLLSTNAPNGEVIVWIDGEPCWLQNVLALARRKGLV